MVVAVSLDDLGAPGLFRTSLRGVLCQFGPQTLRTDDHLQEGDCKDASPVSRKLATGCKREICRTSEPFR